MILFHEHESELLCPGDKVTILFSEVMYDRKNGISGHNPNIIMFILEKKRIFEAWGYHVEILHAEKDYLDVFFHKLSRSPDPTRIGMTHGFVPAGKCAVKRDCKLKPITDWYKNCTDRIVEYVGIAIDEPKRLQALHRKKNAVSLLEKYNLTEADAMDLCRKYDMLSPQYSMDDVSRDGCWFCEHAKLCEQAEIAALYPDVWRQFVALESMTDLAYPKWNTYTKETLRERDRNIQAAVERRKTP